MAAIATSAKSAETEGFVKLPLSFFRTAAAPQVDLYCLPEGCSQPTLFACRSLGITESQLAELEDRGQLALFVRNGDLYDTPETLLESLEKIVADDSFPADQRYQVLQAAIAMEVERSFRLTDCRRFLALAEQVGTQLTELVSHGAVAPHELFAIAEHDTTTFVHLTNVAAYAAMLAEALGISKPQERRQIAIGAMLHDFGKRTIPNKLLTKPGKLNADEREIVEDHPWLGYVELCSRDDLTHGQLMMVYQHHEWLNGGGYPVGILGDEIHPWAKLVAVVDVFDALTAKRPYRSGMNPDDALNVLSDGADKQFETEIVQCWISLFRRRHRS